MIVRCYGQLRQILKKDSVTMADRLATLNELIQHLAAENGPEVREELLDENGNIDYSYAVFVNGQRIYQGDAPLSAEDEVTITSVIAGGDDLLNCCLLRRHREGDRRGGSIECGG